MIKGEKNFEKGITLVVLVVTIVVLLILAGIAISALSGENGLLKYSKKASTNYSISTEKEKIELAITDLRVELETKGEEISKEKLIFINSEEIDVRDTNNFPVVVICGKHKFNVDENYIVTYLGAVDETVVTYTTEPTSYTNKNEVKILIKLQNSKGLSTLKYPNGEVENLSGKTEKNIEYLVSKNGKYNFQVIDIEGNEVNKNIDIELIDTEAPMFFTPDVKANDTGIEIIAETTDLDANENSCKSGIDYYEYYIKRSKDTEYNKYNINEIKNLETNTYNIYVIAYDKAGNSKKSEEITYKFTVKISVEKISESGSSFYVIDKNGLLWSKGNNYYGQLGDKTTNNSKIAKRILSDENVKFKEISAGEYSWVMALDNDGNIWTWGNNIYGQLGDGTTQNRSIPQKIAVEGNVKFEMISAGKYHALALDENGNIWSWGYNGNSVLGDGTTQSRSVPQKITVEGNVKFKMISSGNLHSLVLDEDGNIWVCGNNWGKYGDGTKASKQVFTKIKNEVKFKYINASYFYTTAISQNGDLYICGDDYGELLKRYTDVGRYINKMTKINGMSNIIEVKASKRSETMVIIAIDSNGYVWTLGKTAWGELGTGEQKAENEVFTKITSDNVKYKSIDLCGSNVIALDENKDIWSWGDIAWLTDYTTNQYFSKPTKINF